MRTIQYLPELETLTPVPGDKGTSFVSVQMPFADIRGVVAGSVVRLGNGNSVIVQSHVVQKDAVGKWVPACHQARTIRAAHRTARHSVTEIDALSCEFVQVWRQHILISGIAGSLRAPLVREDKDKIRLLPDAFRGTALWCSTA